jgi:hypothetical protein
MDGPRWTTGATFLGAVLSLTCCALPSALVTLGLGGAVASLVSAAPGVTFLSAHKIWVFAVVGVLHGLSWAATTGRLPVAWARVLACPTGRAPRNVRRLWSVSAALYGLSLAVAYLGAPFARLLWR